MFLLRFPTLFHFSFRYVFSNCLCLPYILLRFLCFRMLFLYFAMFCYVFPCFFLHSCYVLRTCFLHVCYVLATCPTFVCYAFLCFSYIFAMFSYIILPAHGRKGSCHVGEILRVELADSPLRCPS